MENDYVKYCCWEQKGIKFLILFYSSLLTALMEKSIGKYCLIAKQVLNSILINNFFFVREIMSA